MDVWPHRVTIQRRKWAGDTRKERYEGVTTVATGVRALISPASTSLQLSPGGPAEILRDLVFLEPSADVEVNDRLVDEATGDVWLVVSPPKRLQCPVSWQDSHLEVEVTRDVTG